MIFSRCSQSRSCLHTHTHTHTHAHTLSHGTRVRMCCRFLFRSTIEVRHSTPLACPQSPPRMLSSRLHACLLARTAANMTYCPIQSVHLIHWLCMYVRAVNLFDLRCARGPSCSCSTATCDMACVVASISNHSFIQLHAHITEEQRLTKQEINIMVSSACSRDSLTVTAVHCPSHPLRHSAAAPRTSLTFIVTTI